MTAHRHHPIHHDDHEEVAAKEREHARAHAYLWIAVAVTMGFILVFWAVLLPSQIKKGGFISDEGLDRWRVLREDSEVRTFQESLRDVRSKLDALSEEQLGDRTVEQIVDEQEATELEFAKLRERIENTEVFEGNE